jgi:hypothetical protein
MRNNHEPARIPAPSEAIPGEAVEVLSAEAISFLNSREPAPYAAT